MPREGIIWTLHVLMERTMSDFGNPDNSPGFASLLSRGLAHLAAVDPAANAAGPMIDRQSAARTGLAIAAAFFFSIFSITTAITLAYGDWRTLLIAAAPALLLAMIITVIDQTMIAARAMEYGHKLARERGFDNGVKHGFFDGVERQVLGLVKWAARIFVAGLQASVVGTVLSLSLMSVDIHVQLEADRSAVNAPIITGASGEVDRDIAAARTAAQAAGADIDRAEDRRDELAKTVAADVASLAAERRARINEMIRQRDKADALAYWSQRVSSAELGGEKIDGHGTGKVGDGTAHKTAEADAALAGARRAALDAEITQLQGVVDVSPSQPALDAADSELVRLRQTRAADDLALEARITSRGAAVIAAAEDDPSFRQPETGMLARLRALGELGESPTSAWFIEKITLWLMLADVAAMFVKLIFTSPNVADIKRSLGFEIAAARAIEEAEAELEHLVAARESRLARARARREARDRDSRARDIAARARARYADDLGAALQAAE
jgi:hypothetical protein